MPRKTVAAAAAAAAAPAKPAAQPPAPRKQPTAPAKPPAPPATRPVAPPPAPDRSPSAGRRARWVWQSEDGLDGLLTITNGGVYTYLYRRLNDWTFMLSELDRGRRTDLYITISPRGSSCGCGEWKDKGTCHHVECLLGLQKAGRL